MDNISRPESANRSSVNLFGESGVSAGELGISSPSFEPNDELRALRYELVRSSQRVIELEARLNVGSPDVEKLDRLANEKRQVVAELQTQIQIVRAELGALKSSKTSKTELRDDDGSKEDMVSQFTYEIKEFKISLQTEIQDLISQRNELLDENLRLTKLRQQTLNEADQLNAKNMILLI